ncbi:MAG: hypothetical protein WCC11_02240 [Gammaproteobacteria bacterium]
MHHQMLRPFLTAVLTIVTFGAQAQQLVKWEGLCIPKERVSWMQPGGGPQQNGPVAEALNHLKPELGQFNNPGIIVGFTGKEMAKAIPGYTGASDFKNSDGSIVHLHWGSVVIIKPVKNAVQPYEDASIINLGDLWNLTGKWTGSDVTRLAGTRYYKVIRRDIVPYGLWISFDLVKINPSSKSKGNLAFHPVSNWYIGYCGVIDATQPAMGFRCHRSLIGKTFYTQYSVVGKNINFINQIDDFMKDHVRKWASNCSSAAN